MLKSGKSSQSEISDNNYINMISEVFRTILEASDDLLFIKDENLKYMYCSIAVARLVGYEKIEDVVGKTDFDLFDPEKAQQYRNDDMEVLYANRPIINKEEVIPSDDGELHYSCTSKYVLRDNQGKVVGLYGVGRDVTEYRAFQAKINLLKDSSTAVFVADVQTYDVLYANQQCANICGKDLSFAKSQKCYKYLHDLDEPCENCFAKLVNDQSYTEYEYTNPNTEKHYKARGKLINWANRRAIAEYLSDETNAINLRQRLEADQQAIELAIRNSRMLFWEYNIDRKTILYKNSPETTSSSPQGILGTSLEYLIENKIVHPDDAAEILILCQKLSDDAEFCECTVRIKKLENEQYIWKRIACTRLHDSHYTDRRAIGFSIDVDDEQNVKVRHERELQLRFETIKDLDNYFEVNLTTRCIIDSMYSANKGLNIIDLEYFKNYFLKNVIEDDCEKLCDMFYIDKLMEKYKNGQDNVSLEYRRKTPDGTFRWMLCTASIMRKPNSSEIIAYIYIKNIDLIKKTQMALQSIIDEEIDTISLLNIKTKLAQIIKGNYYFGTGDVVEYDEFGKAVLISLVVREDREQCLKFFDYMNLISELEDNSKLTIIYRAKDEQGRIRHFRSTAYYLDYTRNDIVITRRDITAAYEMEIKQKELLQHAADVASAANRAKTDFLSRMSHDMRTPMNAIIGLTNLLKTEQDKAEIAKYLNNIDISSSYLLSLINDMLDLNQIEDGKIEIHEEIVSFEEFEKNLRIVIAPLMEKKDIQFKMDFVDAIPYVLIDKIRYMQIIFNLLSNACKYTLNGGKVDFILKRLPECDGKIGIRHIIKDNGVGMSEDFLKILFLPFEREKNETSSDQDGCGLGLAIVKKLVDALGGTISVKSRLGEGTEFTVDLYMDEANESDIKERDAVADEICLSGVKILLVEDNEINAMIAQKILEAQKCIVAMANNGQEAIEMLQKSIPGTYDVILMDVRMPVLNGLEATKRIRKLDREDASKIPIIAMTADVFSDDMLSTKDAGMDAHIAKPINSALLYRTIVEQLNLAKKQ